MATVDECRQALHDLSTRLETKGKGRDKLSFDRTLACRLTDLGVAFHGHLTGGRLIDLTDGDDTRANIALTTTSDDLIALVRGQLDVAKALANRRLSVSANPFDLLKLRKLF